MSELETVKLLKCLGDHTRLQILKSLAAEDMYVERLAQRLGVTPPTISFHLKKLMEVKAVTAYKNQYYMMYSLHREVFEVSLLDILNERSDEEALQRQRDQAYRQSVINAFFAYGKLKSIPTQRKKERIILEEIVKAFAFDKLYTEREVNVSIADYYDDFCTIRRDMVAEGLLNRNQNGYWRIDENYPKKED